MIFLWLGGIYLYHLPEKSPLPRLDSGFLGPLTTPEKILLGYRLSMNEMQESDWEILSGIGPTRAKSILLYKKTNGKFERVEELLFVPGIGPKILEQLHPFLKV